MAELEQLQHVLLVQQTHELSCPDCEACITHNVILQKRKREYEDFSTSTPTTAAEEGEPYSDELDYALPQVLLEQESHELICPECDHSITDKVILQKRKRELEAVAEGRHDQETEDELYDSWESSMSSMSFTRESASSVSDAAEEDEFYMRTVLLEQTTHELSCPDCDACITHDVILQKRKRPSSPSEIVARQDRDWQLQPPPMRGHVNEIEQLEDSDQEDPPLKRYRSLKKDQARGADPEDDEIKRILREQATHELTCPDCNSLITNEVILQGPQGRRRAQPKTQTSPDLKEVVVHLDKKGRLRKSIKYADKNPWRTRHKAFYRGLRNISSAGDLVSSREDPQTRVAKYGSAKYSASRSLTEPLLPVQEGTGHQAAGLRARAMRIIRRVQEINFREDIMNGQASWSYFLVFLFLWCIWLFLRLA